MILSVLTSKASARVGVPSLLVFLLVGMVAGSEGMGGIYFDNAAHAQAVGVVALAYILFAGGLDTDLKTIRPVLSQGVSLATIGVLLTCFLTGWFAKLALGFSWLEGLLLGAIVSSTDAAAVFTVLRGRGTGLEGKIKPLLELESGANDPMAVLLTVGILELILEPNRSVSGIIPSFLKQLAIGGVLGAIAGRGISALLNQMKLEFEGLYPVLSLALVILLFALTQTLGGSGFLAVYLAGLLLGNQNFIHKKSLIHFHDGIAWLMQIAMFLVLGLLVFPSKLREVAVPGFSISGFLILVARPVAVFVSLIGAGYNWRQKAMISWIGLRGSVPIILATYPLLAGIEKADVLFNLVFFTVLTSVLIQGTSIPFIAKLLRLGVAEKPKFRYPIEYVPTGDMKNDLVEVDVPRSSPAAGRPLVELGLPKETLIVLIQRDGKVIVPRGGTHLEGGDSMLVLAEKAKLGEIRRIVGS